MNHTATLLPSDKCPAELVSRLNKWWRDSGLEDNDVFVAEPYQDAERGDDSDSGDNIDDDDTDDDDDVNVRQLALQVLSEQSARQKVREITDVRVCLFRGDKGLTSDGSGGVVVQDAKGRWLFTPFVDGLQSWFAETPTVAVPRGSRTKRATKNLGDIHNGYDLFMIEPSDDYIYVFAANNGSLRAFKLKHSVWQAAWCRVFGAASTEKLESVSAEKNQAKSSTSRKRDCESAQQTRTRVRKSKRE